MGIIVILILLVCLITSVPIAISLGVATLVGLFLISPDFLITMLPKSNDVKEAILGLNGAVQSCPQ